MAINQTQPNLRGLSVGSIMLGVLGAVCFWWNPMGMVLSLAGLTTGLVDWIMAGRKSEDYRLSIVGTVISAVALCVSLAIAYLGWQAVTLTGP